jgi:hypothetical protein
MGKVRNVTHKGEIGYVCKIVFEKPKGERSLGKPKPD